MSTRAPRRSRNRRCLSARCASSLSASDAARRNASAGGAEHSGQRHYLDLRGSCEKYSSEFGVFVWVMRAEQLYRELAVGQRAN